MTQEAIERLQFEMQRRVILFRRDTTMPDGTQLGYDGDPNNATLGVTDGETLIYNSPTGTRYEQTDGTQWYKKEKPNVWETIGSPEPFYQQFTISDWISGAGAYYIEFLHEFNAPVSVYVREGNKEVSVETYSVSNNIEKISVPNEPDLRFEGSILIKQY